jgi:hypothetical protein
LDGLTVQTDAETVARGKHLETHLLSMYRARALRTIRVSSKKGARESGKVISEGQH